MTMSRHNVCSDLEEASVAKHIHNRPLLLITLAHRTWSKWFTLKASATTAIKDPSCLEWFIR